jgi:hypothetical protein
VQLLFDDYPRVNPAAGIGGRRKVKYMSWDVSRDTLWVNDMAGNLYGMTRDRKLSVTAWHTHQLGGFNAAQGVATIGAGGNTTADAAYYCCDGSVISHAAIPNAFSEVNDLWMIVKRTINSVVTWQLERMVGRGVVRQSVFEVTAPGAVPGEPAMVDCAYVYAPVAPNPSTGFTLAQLAGNSGLTGTYYNNKTGMFEVTTGALDGSGNCVLNSNLPVNYNLADGSVATITLGFPFTPVVQPVTVEAGSQMGTAQAAIHVISRAFCRLYKSMTLQIGTQPGGEDTNPAERAIFNNWESNIELSPEVYTGLKDLLVPGTYSRDDTIYITALDPLPFELTSIVYEGDEHDQV